MSRAYKRRAWFKTLKVTLPDMQGWICPRCDQRLIPRAKNVAERTAVWRAGRSTTIDHVWPLPAPLLGNALAMHLRCNDKKANSKPTGCDLVWLAAVNARQGI